MAKVDRVKKIANNKLEITIHQGWKRQIRRMLASCGYQVIDLLRLQEGKLTLGDLLPGKYKVLNKAINFLHFINLLNVIYIYKIIIYP